MHKRVRGRNKPRVQWQRMTFKPERTNANNRWNWIGITTCCALLGLLWIVFHFTRESSVEKSPLLSYTAQSGPPLDCYKAPRQQCSKTQAKELYKAWNAFLSSKDFWTWQQWKEKQADEESKSGGRGILFLADAKKLPVLKLSLELLRQTGCDLPVEVFWWNKPPNQECTELTFGNVRCRDLHNEAGAKHSLSLWCHGEPCGLRHLALMYTRFEHVLMLDPGSLLFANPAKLFDSKEYRRDGAMFWPDLWGSNTPEGGQTAKRYHVMWSITNVPWDRADYTHRQEQARGILLLDRKRHWKPLQLALWFTNNTFIRKSIGGDKDSFRFAWLALKVKFHLIQHPVSLLGVRNVRSCGGL